MCRVARRCWLDKSPAQAVLPLCGNDGLDKSGQQNEARPERLKPSPPSVRLATCTRQVTPAGWDSARSHDGRRQTNPSRSQLTWGWADPAAIQSACALPHLREGRSCGYAPLPGVPARLDGSACTLRRLQPRCRNLPEPATHCNAL